MKAIIVYLACRLIKLVCAAGAAIAIHSYVDNFYVWRRMPWVDLFLAIVLAAVVFS